MSGEAGLVRATDGRVPGRRGIATRGRLLACTAELLSTTSYRDIKVIERAKLGHGAHHSVGFFKCDETIFEGHPGPQLLYATAHEIPFFELPNRIVRSIVEELRQSSLYL